MISCDVGQCDLGPPRIGFLLAKTGDAYQLGRLTIYQRPKRHRMRTTKPELRVLSRQPATPHNGPTNPRRQLESVDHTATTINIETRPVLSGQQSTSNTRTRQYPITINTTTDKRDGDHSPFRQSGNVSDQGATNGYDRGVSAILDVDLLAFERGDRQQRAAVVDGVRRSLTTGFVYTSHDLSTDMLDTAYAMLKQFFDLPAEEKAGAVVPGSNGQAGYTGLLVETAASSDSPDWKEMINWGADIPTGHPLQTRYPDRYLGPHLPEAQVPGITSVLIDFYERVLDLQRRFLRIIAVGIGCHETFFDEMIRNGTTLTRAIHYPPMAVAPGGSHVWAAEHGDINLITALPRATSRGLQVKTDGGWIDAVPPDDGVIINTGIMLEYLTNGVISQGIHRVVAEPGQSGDRYSVVQFCHPTPWTILQPVPSCIDEQNPQRFAPIEAGNLLDQVLYDINLVEDARRVG